MNDNTESSVLKNLNFSSALHCIQDGLKMSRTAWWDDKRMFVFLVDGSTFLVNRKPLLGIYKEGTSVTYHPHIDMSHRDGYITPWTPTQADMLSKDWYVLNITDV